MFETKELVKMFDNVFPVKTIDVALLKSDGTTEIKTFFEIDYEEAEKIRQTMTPAERERQRSIL